MKKAAAVCGQRQRVTATTPSPRKAEPLWHYMRSVFADKGCAGSRSPGAWCTPDSDMSVSRSRSPCCRLNCVCLFVPTRVAGSCNGLQHYAALGLDAKGGAQVNLVPSSKPQDVYSGVCEIVKKKVRGSFKMRFPVVHTRCSERWSSMKVCCSLQALHW